MWTICSQRNSNVSFRTVVEATDVMFDHIQRFPSKTPTFPVQATSTTLPTLTPGESLTRSGHPRKALTYLTRNYKFVQLYIEDDGKKSE